MERIIKLLISLLFPQWHPKAEKKRGKMTLFHVMALNNINKGSIRPLSYGVMGLRKGVSGYGGSLFKAKYRPGSLFSIKNARILCREEARTNSHFEVLFIDNSPYPDKVLVLCPVCDDYWAWEETIENDLSQEAGRLCPECLSKLNQVVLARSGLSIFIS